MLTQEVVSVSCVIIKCKNVGKSVWGVIHTVLNRKEIFLRYLHLNLFYPSRYQRLQV